MPTAVTRTPAGQAYVVGLDLGTTQSALAYAPMAPSAAGATEIASCPIPQLVAPAEVAARATLPSFLYLPGPHELPDGALSLPWAHDRSFAVGELARRQGALVPGRLISSAKSWLNHGGVDRTKPLLPWGGDEAVGRWTIVDVQARYLAHLAEAWSAHWSAQGLPVAPLGEQQLVLTVPASFDPVARELTLEAARRAGLSAHLTLLEEPQAAFYAWLRGHGETGGRGGAGALAAGELVLVCDVGGGTTDFTLIRVQPAAPDGPGGVELERIAVGEHLLLGGDNMDLALARQVEQQLVDGGGRPLAAGDFALLVQRCRDAKERLLAEQSDGRQEAPGQAQEVKVLLPGRGSKLLGAAAHTTLTRRQVEALLVDGFFPRVAVEAQPERGRLSGLGEWGLPFAVDPAITRHLATFLRRHGGALPDAVLFNGGVFAASALRARVVEVLASWRGGVPPRELRAPAPGLELAVAWGAAAFGLARAGRGARVRAGAARAYFIEVAPPAGRSLPTGELAVVCVGQRGQPPGTEQLVGGSSDGGPLPLRLRANRPVQFRLLSSASRDAAVGQVLFVAHDELHEVSPLSTVLRFGRPSVEVAVPVRLGVMQTELGTLELSLVSEAPARAGGPPERWRLQFDVRGARGEVEGIEPRPAGAPTGIGSTGIGAEAASAAGAPPPQPQTAPAPPAAPFPIDAADDSAPGGLPADASRAGGPSADASAPTAGTAPPPPAPGPAAADEPVAERLVAAQQLIRECFGPSRGGAAPVAPAALPKALEQVLGRGRADWTSATLRQLWEPLRAAFGRHAESVEHEARWLHLAGYCLRPGLGVALDDWRLRDVWRAFHTPLVHEREERVRVESWILWRRVAAGLRAGQQEELLKRIAPVLVPPSGRPVSWRKPPSPQEAVEMWRCAAVLERVAASAKVALGEALLARIERRDVRKDRLGYALWALARLGARQLVYGPAQNVVPPEVAAGWIHRLLATAAQRGGGAGPAGGAGLGAGITAEELGFALAQLARRTGDRARDLEDVLRERVVHWVAPLSTAARLRSLLRGTVPPLYSEQEQRALLGESLPPGLSLGVSAQCEPLLCE